MIRSGHESAGTDSGEWPGDQRSIMAVKDPSSDGRTNGRIVGRMIGRMQFTWTSQADSMQKRIRSCRSNGTPLFVSAKTAVQCERCKRLRPSDEGRRRCYISAIWFGTPVPPSRYLITAFFFELFELFELFEVFQLRSGMHWRARRLLCGDHPRRLKSAKNVNNSNVYTFFCRLACKCKILIASL